MGILIISYVEVYGLSIILKVQVPCHYRRSSSALAAHSFHGFPIRILSANSHKDWPDIALGRYAGNEFPNRQISESCKAGSNLCNYSFE
jgi:hypothetical protein